VAMADADVTLWARREDGQATIGIRGGDQEWLDQASVELRAFDPAIVDGELRFAIQRSQLRSV
jgi:hypothetical protein